MSLSERIQKDLVDAMRAKDELRLSVLRGMKAAIKHKEVEKIRVLDESESIQILQTLVKQRKESIEQFTKGNRPELADKETKELAILESYLPASASKDEMNAAIDKAIAETAANSMKQMGAVVKAAKSALRRQIRRRQSPQRSGPRAPRKIRMNCYSRHKGHFKNALLSLRLNPRLSQF